MSLPPIIMLGSMPYLGSGSNSMVRGGGPTLIFWWSHVTYTIFPSGLLISPRISAIVLPACTTTESMITSVPSGIPRRYVIDLAHVSKRSSLAGDR